jgi:hypothetical protein
MFRAVHRSSSGAITLFAAFGLHKHVVTGRSPHAYVNRRLQIQLELLMMSGVSLETCWAFNERWNNKFYYKVASDWLFLLSHTAMHGSMNIKDSAFCRQNVFSHVSDCALSEFLMLVLPSTPNVGYLTGTTVCFLRSRNWVFKCHLKWPSDVCARRHGVVLDYRIPFLLVRRNISIRRLV